MPSVLSRIWTRVAVSISYDDNHYTTAPNWIYGQLIQKPRNEFETGGPILEFYC